ncbi:hypothetical protein BDR04DRAFT_1104770 [Suillus decipiens]|nr:hypothetical protein BDR04DRAFT_1104770 [Suillus decipiens]
MSFIRLVTSFQRELFPLTLLFTGESILAADAIDHQRHRKIMNWYRSTSSIFACFPSFGNSGKMVKKFHGNSVLCVRLAVVRRGNQ